VYFNVNFNVFFKLIKVHLLVSELYSKYYFLGSASTPDFSYENKFSRFFFLILHQNLFMNQKPQLFLQLLFISTDLLPSTLHL